MNHWYVSLNGTYPKSCKVRQVTYKPPVQIIEMFNEAEPKEIDRHKLVYVGFGYFSDVEKAIRRLSDDIQ